MKNARTQNITLWVLAFILMVAAAMYQRMTGPNYPVSGKKVVEGVTLKYSLSRSSDGDYQQTTGLTTSDPSVTGRLFFKRFKTDDTLTAIALVRDGEKLTATLPHFPAAAKLEYHLELDVKGMPVRLPETGVIVTRSRDDVPLWIMLPHILIMFIGMLFAVRAGIEVFRKEARPYAMIFWALVLLAIGGLIFGPLVQKYSFGVYWSGWPFGGDLTDNKTIFMVVAWLVAWLMNRKVRDASPAGAARWVILGATVVTLIVYLIPHSLFGSELKYDKLDQPRPAAELLR